MEYDQLAYKIMLRDLSKAFAALGLRSDCDDSGPLACRSHDAKLVLNAFVVPQVTVITGGKRHHLAEPHIQVLVTVDGNTLPPAYAAAKGEPIQVARVVVRLIADLIAKHVPQSTWVKRLESSTKALDQCPDAQTFSTLPKLLGPGS